MSTAQKLLKSSVARVVYTLVNIGVGIFMLPFMVGHLGEDLYGLWIIVGGLTATLYIFDFGFASAVQRYVAHDISTKDYESANRTISSALVIYTILAVTVAMATLVIAWFSAYWLETSENLSLVQSLIVLLGLSLAISFPFKAFAGIARAYIRYDLIAWSGIFVKILSTVCVVLALSWGYQLIAIALVQFVTSIIHDLIFLAIAKHLFRPMKIARAYVDPPRVRTLFHYSGWAFLIDSATIAKSKSDIFLVGAFLGTSTLTIYYVAVRLVGYGLEFLTQATNMTTPIFVGYQARGDIDGLKSKLVFFLRMHFLVGTFAAYGLFLLGEPFIKIWMGVDFDYQSAYQVLCILIAGGVITFIFSPLGSALMAISRHQSLAILGFGEALVSIAIIYVMLAMFDGGIVAVAWGVVTPFFVSRTIILPIIMRYELQVSVANLYQRILFPMVLATIAYALSNILFMYFSQPSSVIGLIVYGVAISGIYWGICHVCITKEEWGFLLQLIPPRVLKTINEIRSRR